MATSSFVVIYDAKRNALNLIRLCLAVSVIIYHAFPISGHHISPPPLQQLAGNLGVDGFFAISGFLILSSWTHRPEAFAFIRARVLRIFPAFWVCLILTAAVFAPLSLLIRGTPAPAGFVGAGAKYVVTNALLDIFHYDIAGTPAAVPYPHVWDGALWTLMWEFACYIGILALGVGTLIRRRPTIALVFLLALATLIAVDYGVVHNFYLDHGARFGIMFAAGALVFRYQDWIPVRWFFMVIAGVVIVASAFALKDYAVVAAIPVAYLVLCVGALGKHPRLTLHNDLSYGTYIYGFPVAQVLATLGATSLGVPVFALLSVLATLPVAAASWFLIERHALKLKAGPRRPVEREDELRASDVVL